MQTWKIQKDRLFGEMDVQGARSGGGQFLAAESAGGSDRVYGGRVARYEGQRATARRRTMWRPDRDGVLTAHATFEMPVPDFSKGIPLPTGAAAIQRVTIQLDQAGWEFSSPAAVSVHAHGGAAGGAERRDAGAGALGIR